jgi:hypothetical protein
MLALTRAGKPQNVEADMTAAGVALRLPSAEKRQAARSPAFSFKLTLLWEHDVVR